MRRNTQSHSCLVAAADQSEERRLTKKQRNISWSGETHVRKIPSHSDMSEFDKTQHWYSGHEFSNFARDEIARRRR